MMQPSIKDIFETEYRRDYFIHKTAKARNKLYNFKILTKKIARVTKGQPIGTQEGWVKLRVKRAKRNAKGIPIDINGKEIDISDAIALRENCVYERDWFTVEDFKHNLLVTSGKDWVHAQLWTNTAAGTRGANYVGLTDDATGTAAGDTTLPGELDNTNGLGRKVADTITHTAGTNTTVLVTTWTATNAGDTGIQMAGTFYHASTTTAFVLENIFTSTNLAAGDSLELTWTITTS
jgi:hypothetical protein